MVKGISRQVIVVQAPDPDLFEQAIFILKDGREGVSDEALMQEATRLINRPTRKRMGLYLYGTVWALGGALVTAIAWVLTILF